MPGFDVVDPHLAPPTRLEAEGEFGQRHLLTTGQNEHRRLAGGPISIGGEQDERIAVSSPQAQHQDDQCTHTGGYAPLSRRRCSPNGLEEKTEWSNPIHGYLFS